MMVKSKNGALTNKDIFTIPNSIILHICNIQGVFGAGFAASLNEVYPCVKEKYLSRYRAGNMRLGSFIMAYPKSGQLVANLLAMPDYRRDRKDKSCHLSYEALWCSLASAKEFIDFEHDLKHKLIVIPHGMGAGNAGGDWQRVLEIMDEHFPFYVVCKKKN